MRQDDQFVLTDEERAIIEARRAQHAQAEALRIDAAKLPDVNAMTPAQILDLPPETRQNLFEHNLRIAMGGDCERSLSRLIW